MLNRRTFTATALSAAASAATTPPPLEAALITHADGPHLSAYIEGIAQTPEIGTVSLCDHTGQTEAAVRKGVGAKFLAAYKTPAELFAARKPTFALITMEAKLAPPAIAAALKAGCHIMAEKPACVRAADFAPLAAQAEAAKRNLMLALANRKDPYQIEARRLVQSGELGKVYGVDLQIIADQTRLTRPAYHKTWTAQRARSGGGHLIWLGIHWLDHAMYITGSPITQVAGFTGNIGGQPIDTEDSAALTLRFANGSFGNLTSGYYIDRGKQLSIKVWGSDGWLEFRNDDSPSLVWYTKKGLQRYQAPAGAPSLYTTFVQHAARAAAGIEPPVLSPAESLRVLRVVFAGYHAAETGRTQNVES
ncbi:MAG: Gfo/Idh/MocA family oxidoreductase [Bryobacterales bacterium]|nr:Gfo/Idh/MocA family oxidoreductase [Bryobacterales bacterium]